MEGFRPRVELKDSSWILKLTNPIPRPVNPWGVLLPLKDTPWGKLIKEVSGDAISHAYHGYLTPLAREIGRHPKDVGKRLTVLESTCKLAQNSECDLVSNKCTVRGIKNLPFCYEAPLLTGVSFELANYVAQEWNDGYYVIVIVGEEFSLR